MAKYHHRQASCVECEDCGHRGAANFGAYAMENARFQAGEEGWLIYGPKHTRDNRNLAPKFLCPTCLAKQDRPKRVCRTCDYGSYGERERNPSEQPCNSATGCHEDNCTAWCAIGEGEGEGEDLPAPESDLVACVECLRHVYKMGGRHHCYSTSKNTHAQFDHVHGRLLCEYGNKDGKCLGFERAQSTTLAPCSPDVQDVWFHAWDEWADKIGKRVGALEHPEPKEAGCEKCESEAQAFYHKPCKTCTRNPFHRDEHRAKKD